MGRRRLSRPASNQIADTNHRHRARDTNVSRRGARIPAPFQTRPNGAEVRTQTRRRVPEFRGLHPRAAAGRSVLSVAPSRRVARDAGRGIGTSSSINGASTDEHLVERTRSLGRDLHRRCRACPRSSGSPSSRATVSPRLSASKTVNAAPARSSNSAIRRSCSYLRHAGSASEPRRLERVVSAFRDQRSADKGDPATRNISPSRQACPLGRCPCRPEAPRPTAPGDFQSLSAEHLGDRGAPRRMTRRDDRQQPGMLAPIRTCAAAAISSSPGCVLAAIQIGRLPIRLRSAASSAGSAASKGAAAFKSPTLAASARRAPEPRSLMLVLGQAKRESLQHRPDQPRHIAPAPERARRKAAVEQQHRNSASPCPEHQIRPELGFDPDREIGTPMVEEPIARRAAGRRGRTDAGPGSASVRRAAAPRPRFRSSAGVEAGAVREDAARSRRAPNGFAHARSMDPDQLAREAGRCRQPRSARRSARGLPCRVEHVRAE